MNCSTLSWYLEMCVTKLCFTVRCSNPAAFLSKLTNVKMCKHLFVVTIAFGVLSDVQLESKSKLCFSGRGAGHRRFGSSKTTTSP